LNRARQNRGSGGHPYTYHALMMWLWFLAGVAVGGLMTAMVALVRRGRIGAEAAGLRARVELLDGLVRDRVAEAQDLRAALAAESLSRAEAERRIAVLHEQNRVLEEAEKRLTNTFQAVGARALRDNNQQFLDLAAKTMGQVLTEARGDVEKRQQAIDSLIRPIREALEKQGAALTDLERKREVAYKEMETQIKSFASLGEGLRRETGNLVTALRRPEVRGRWGEVQLRNCVELAGMARHCDFAEQVSRDGEDGRLQPDMIVKLPGGGTIVIDAKCALDAYLDALAPERDRSECLARHAAQLERHVSGLAAKEYWKRFERAPKVVVMFVPLESALTAALEVKPDLHADAMASHVLIATPSLLVALLRAVAYGWQQEDVAANARQIADAGSELYERLSGFAAKVSAMGGRLESAVSAYNAAIGSLESRVLPSARRLRDLHATTAPEVEAPEPLQIEVRPVNAAELKPLPDAAPPAVPRAPG
jgi:DNA recombination protein RmuC